MFEIPDTYFTVQEQTTLVLSACLLGLPMGLLFDLFRMLRVLFRHAMVVVAIEDILFCCTCAVTLAAFTSVACRGEFRLFYPVGMLLGCLLWRFTVGNSLLKITRKTAGFLRRFLSQIFHPAAVFFARIQWKIKQKFRHVIQNLKKKKKNAHIPLIADRHLLYNKKKQQQEVNQNGRCRKTKSSATAEKKANLQRRRAVQPAGSRQKQKRKISV